MLSSFLIFSRVISKLISLCFLMAVSTFAYATQTIEEFEKQLDMTIRSACHGYMVDAIPDFFSEQRTWLNQNTPFCQTVRTLSNDVSAVDLFEQELKEQSPKTASQIKSEFRRLWDPNDLIFSECQDWMCQHIRTEQQQRKHPVTLAQYQQVERHCDGSYGCIEDWFSSWPRELPIANSPILSLDSLMSEPSPDEKNTKPSGLSLDSLMGSDTSTSREKTNSGVASSLAASTPELSLDNIHAARAAIKLDALSKKLSRRQNAIRRLCDCSLSASGCYQLPSKQLLDSANNIETQRLSACSQADLARSPNPLSIEEGEQYQAALAKAERNIKALDHEMQSQARNWNQEQKRRLAAQRKQQEDRSDTAFLAGIATIVGGAGLVNDGMISAEQLASTAARLTNDIDSGKSVSSSIGSAVSSVSSSVASTQSSGGMPQGSDGVYNISCYNAAQMICIDYTIYNSKQYEQFQKQCSIYPNKIIGNGCSREGASCTTSSPKGKQVMFVYNVAAEQIRNTCASSNGQFTQY